MTLPITAKHISDQLTSGASLCDRELELDIDGYGMRIRSNSAALLDRLAAYFSHIVRKPVQIHTELIAIESSEPKLDLDFKDWGREPSKRGRKDSYIDLRQARVLRKVRTGMVFLQQARNVIAAGPCLANDNQVINFINAQYMNWLQQRDWLICHAAGLCRRDSGKAGRSLAIAGFSGGGKSTLMLKMLEDDSLQFASNDRLFIKRNEHGEVQAAGIPKMPRINPGTIVHNPRLQEMIPQPERNQLLALPQDQLWELEQKYDVMVDKVYGKNRIHHRSQLAAFLILNWDRNSKAPFQLAPVNLSQRLDLLKAIIKSPGPFYQNASGRFLEERTPQSADAYLSALADVPVFEASGAVDFDQLSQAFNQLTE